MCGIGLCGSCLLQQIKRTSKQKGLNKYRIVHCLFGELERERVMASQQPWTSASIVANVYGAAPIPNVKAFGSPSSLGKLLKNAFWEVFSQEWNMNNSSDASARVLERIEGGVEFGDGREIRGVHTNGGHNIEIRFKNFDLPDCIKALPCMRETLKKFFTDQPGEFRVQLIIE